jgi:hypothetical protein
VLRMANAWLTNQVTNPPPNDAVSNPFMDGLRAYLRQKQYTASHQLLVTNAPYFTSPSGTNLPTSVTCGHP